MATAKSTSIRHSNALERLTSAADALAELLDVGATEVPRHKDIAVQRAMEMETAADLLESVVRSLRKKAVASAVVPTSTRKKAD